MRVSPVGWAFDTLEKTEEVAKLTAEITHNNPEGIKGAQATAAAIFLALTLPTKEEIKLYIETTFGYDLSPTCDEIRSVYSFNESCQGSVPEVIIAFLDSPDFESAIRLAVSPGCDSDTLACITGGIAEAYYSMSHRIPQSIDSPGSHIGFREKALDKLPKDMPIIMTEFYERFLMFMNFAIMADAKDKETNGKNEVPLKTLLSAFRFDAKVVIESEGIIDRCKNMTADVLLLGGQRSQLYLKTALDVLSLTFPNAKRVEFRGQGHLAADNGGKPEVVAKELRNFFRT